MKFNNKSDLKILVGLIILVVLLWAGSYFMIRILVQDKSTFGNTFGAVNALFSGLAFAALIYTVVLQMRELELTRAEFRKTSEAQKKTEEALAQEELQRDKTAKLSALASLVEHHSTVANGFSALHDYPSFNSEVQKATPYIEEIKKLTNL